MLRPRMSLVVGSLRSTTEAPAGAPVEVVVERDIDVAVDVAVLRFADEVTPGLSEPVTVGLGEGTATTVFTGSVARAGSWTTPAAGRGSEIVALGRLRSLVDLRVAAVYENRTLGVVARDLITRAGVLPGDIDEGPLLPCVAVDVRRSAYAHLRDLARRFGRDVWGDRDGRAHVGMPGAAGGALAAVPAAAGAVSAVGSGPRFGADVLAATGGRRAAALDAVHVAGESPASTRGQTTVAWLSTDDEAARASAGSGDRTRLVLEPLARTRDLAQAAADGRLDAGRRRSNETVVVLTGRGDLDLGDQLTVAGGTGALEGVSGVVRGVRHRVDGVHGFTTTMRLARGGG